MKYNKSIAMLSGLILLSLIGSAIYAQSFTGGVNRTIIAKVGGYGNFPNIRLNPWTNQSLLSSAYNAVSCRTALAASMVNESIAASSKFSPLSTYVSTVESDDVQLKTYSSSGETLRFELYLHGTYDPAVVALYAKQKMEMLNNTNITASQRQALASEFASRVNVYSTCVEPSLLNVSMDKLSFYENVYSNLTNQTAELSAKGLNTTNMTLVLQGAQNDVIGPLQLGIDNNTNSILLQGALAACLFNGCPNGFNYHLDARYDIAKLDALTVKLRNVSNDTVDLNAAQASLNNASVELSAVGSAQYSNGNGAKIWANIYAAVSSLHNAFNKLG